MLGFEGPLRVEQRHRLEEVHVQPVGELERRQEAAQRMQHEEALHPRPLSSRQITPPAPARRVVSQASPPTVPAATTASPAPEAPSGPEADT